MQACVNINGTITPADQAFISILDHGFLFGDSVYDAFRTYDRKLFLFNRHFDRLEHSARGVFLTLPWTRERFRSEMMRTIDAANYAGESKVRLIVTRGIGEVIADPETCSGPTVVIIVAPLRPYPAEMYSDGVEMTVSSIPRGGMVGDYKTGNLMHQVLATREARSRNAYDAILLTTEGYISDGIACNVFMIQDSTLKTPGHEASIIEGITKGVVLKAARNLEMNVVQGLFHPDEIERSSEMFLTGTYREVVPVVRVDGKPIGTGRPGAWTRKIMEAYRVEVSRLLVQED
jgi:branched-chain amino acid aminotransferase